MWAESSSKSMEAAARPLAELLACPPTVGNLLNQSAVCVPFDTGEAVFRQGEKCLGLYLVVSGTLVRKAERRQTRVTLGMARPGDLLELAAALGDELHTCTLTGQTSGTLMMLPGQALSHAFETYPPLRMQLLGELAREISRCYVACSVERLEHTRSHRRQAFAT
jgi:CRP-like cAMP-binding protein